MAILLINACVRKNSRTLVLAKDAMKDMAGEVVELDLNLEKIEPLDTELLETRDRLTGEGKLDDPMFRYARQFRDADVIVIAAPYYDLSFPSSLKNYLEAICCVGLTFYYDEKEQPQTYTKARKIYYVSTGGGALKKQFGFEYVKALVGEFFHIFDVQGFFAEKLDLIGSDPERIMQDAIRNIDNAFPQ